MMGLYTKLAGISILRGPYVVEYTDIAVDGSSKDLWTPVVGDVILNIFPDYQALTQWDQGYLYIGQNVDGAANTNVLGYGPAGTIAGTTSAYAFDMLNEATKGILTDGSALVHYVTGYVCHTTDPVRVQWQAFGGPVATQGHVELYALVAHPLTP